MKKIILLNMEKNGVPLKNDLLDLLVNTIPMSDAEARFKEVPPKPDEKSTAFWQQLAQSQASFSPRKTWGKNHG